MSQFTSPLICVVLDEYKYEVHEPFEYHIGSEGSGDIISIPVGFITDFASIPRVFWSVLSPNGKYTKAAVIHDWMYVNGYESKAYADKTFYEAMLVLGVNKRTAWIMYQSVKVFGKGGY